MAATVDELSVNFSEEDGTQTCKELAKEVLTKGTWATVMFKFTELDRAKGIFKAPKMCIRRYQKRNGEYKVKSKFNFSSAAQATQVATILTKWAAELSDTDTSDGED